MRIPRPQFVSVISPIDAAGLGVAALLTVALVVGVLGPLKLRDRQNAARAQTAARQVQRYNGVVTEVRTLTDEVKAARERIAASRLQIRPTEAVNQCVAGLVSLATECGLTVQDVKPGEGIGAQRFVVVPIRIKASGTFGGTILYLHRLHERLPDIGISAFRLSGSLDQVDDTRSCEFDLAWLAVPQSMTVHDATASLQE